MDAVFWPWLVEVGIISIRDLTGPRRLPVPSELLATFIVFGGLGLVGESATFRRPAVVTAWGLVLATVIVAYAPLKEGGLAEQLLKPVGDFLSGRTGTGPGLNQLAAAGLLPPATGAPAAPGPMVGLDTGNITRGMVG